VIGSNGVSVADMAEVIRTACTGTRTQPYIVSHISDRGGKEVHTGTGHVRPFPVPPEKLELVQSLLRGNIRLPRGTGRSLVDTAKFPIQIMGKTGTSNDHRDAWFCGCTYGSQGRSIAVWVGYDDFGKSLPNEGLPLFKKATGGAVAGPIAKAFFAQVYGEGKPLGKPPSMPDSIEEAIDTYRARAYPTNEK
jgi:membrane peptidoglycan carboxypeptidase